MELEVAIIELVSSIIEYFLGIASKHNRANFQQNRQGRSKYHAVFIIGVLEVCPYFLIFC